MRSVHRRLAAVSLVGVVAAGVAGIAHVATAESLPVGSPAAGAPVAGAAEDTPLPPRQQPDRSQPTGDDPVELIVKLKPGADVEESAERIERVADVEVTDDAEVADDAEALNAVVVETTAEQAAADAADVRRDPSVAYAEVNSRFYASEVRPNDPLAARQDNLSKVDLPTAWERTTGSSDVVVAVLDTGVSAVPELAGALLTGRNFVDPRKVTNAADDEGHGTMVASLIGANTDNGAGIAGACWTCRILPVKVLDKDGGGDLLDVANGIKWAVSQKVDIINLSLGGPYSSRTLDEAIKLAVDNGILVVAAAGNEGETPYAKTKQYPAASPGVLAVGATDNNDNRFDFSNHGPWVDLAAPGWALMQPPTGGPVEALGTSFAAPLVAGVAGLMFAAHPEATSSQVERILKSTAVNSDGSFERGRIDAAAAVAALPFTGRLTPSVRITGPNPRFRKGTSTVTVATGADVASVQGIDGTANLGTDTAAPWTVTWNPDARDGRRAADGTRTIQVVVTGKNGEKTTQGVWLSLDRTLPRVAGAGPAQNSRHRGTVNVTATGVSDKSGIANLTLYADGKWVGRDTTAPYAVKYNLSKRNGPVKLQWKAFDKVGNVGVLNRTIVADNTAPSVRITSGPKDKAKVKGTVKLGVAASDASGISRVELLVNGKKVATDAKAGYTFSVKVSKYGKKLKIQVRAYDKVGNVRTDKTRNWKR
ncbi:MAG TPA: S8 family serine peptidase [Actinoplanes sp.]